MEEKLTKSGVKAFLALQNKIEHYLRLPLTPVSDTLLEQITLLNNKN